MRRFYKIYFPLLDPCVDRCLPGESGKKEGESYGGVWKIVKDRWSE